MDTRQEDQKGKVDDLQRSADQTSTAERILRMLSPSKQGSRSSLSENIPESSQSYSTLDPNKITGTPTSKASLTSKLKKLSPLKNSQSSKSGFSKASSTFSIWDQNKLQQESRLPTSDTIYSQAHIDQLNMNKPKVPYNPDDSRLEEFTIDFTDDLTSIDDYGPPVNVSNVLDHGAHSRTASQSQSQSEIFYSFSDENQSEIELSRQTPLHMVHPQPQLKPLNIKSLNSSSGSLLNKLQTSSNSMGLMSSDENNDYNNVEGYYARRLEERNIRNSQRISGYFRESLIQEDESPIKRNKYKQTYDNSSLRELVHSDNSLSSHSREKIKVLQDNTANSEIASSNYADASNSNSSHNNSKSSSNSSRGLRHTNMFGSIRRASPEKLNTTNFFESSESLGEGDEDEVSQANIAKITRADISAVLKETGPPIITENERYIGRIVEEEEEEKPHDQLDFRNPPSLKAPSFNLQNHSINLFAGTSDGSNESLPSQLLTQNMHRQRPRGDTNNSKKMKRSSSAYSFRKNLPGTTSLLIPNSQSDSAIFQRDYTPGSPNQGPNASPTDGAPVQASYYDLHNLMRMNKAYLKKPRNVSDAEADSSINSFHSADEVFGESNRLLLKTRPPSDDDIFADDSSVYFQQSVWGRKAQSQPSRQFYYHKQGTYTHEYCPREIALFLVIISIIVPPFWLIISSGWLDRDLGKIPKGYKYVSGVLAATMTVGAVVGIGVGFGYGTTH